MARNINRATLIGFLGRDPEVRYTASGAAVANINLATTETWNDKQTGEKQERTEWHRIVAFGWLGEFAGEHLKKGSKVYVEGRLQTRKWQDQSGQDKYTTEIVAGDMDLITNTRGDSSGGGNQSPPPSAPASKGQGGAPASQPADDFDDDIPF